MRRLAALGFGLALCSAAGCDWRKFDDLAKQTNVQNIGAPGGFGASDDFGRVVLPVAPPAGSAARYLVSASGVPALALVDLDPAGNANVQALNPPVIADGDSIVALAASPDGKQVLMGAPGDNGRAYLLSLDATATTTLFAANSMETKFGMGVAVGQLAGAAAPDFVVASVNGLHVYLDGNASAPPLDFLSNQAPSCPIAGLGSGWFTAEHTTRAMVVVGNVVVVAGGDASSVFLFQVSDTAITCLGALTGTASEPGFGQALAVSDFDSDGNPDLLVGTPPQKVYLYRGPLSAASTPVAPPITYTDMDSYFGGALAVGDVDGKPGLELLVGARLATVSGMAGAGAVVVYSGSRFATKLALLAANDPGENAAYGTSVNVLPFCAQPPCTATTLRGLALVGSTTRTFTYFKLEADDTDPRMR
jgi:hypothetical protein